MDEIVVEVRLPHGDFLLITLELAGCRSAPAGRLHRLDHFVPGGRSVRFALLVEIFVDVFGGEPARVLASPVLQRGADWTGRLEVRNVVAAVAAVTGDRSTADVIQPH